MNISRRCSIAEILDTTIKPSTPRQEPRLVSAFSPDTPPDTPEGGHSRSKSRSSDITPIRGTIQKNLESCLIQTSQPITPPSSPLVSSYEHQSQKLEARAFVNTPEILPQQSRPILSITPSHLPWILVELEASVANFPLMMLQPDSAVILELRRHRDPPFPHHGSLRRSPSAVPPRSSRFKPSRSHSSASSVSPSCCNNIYSYKNEDFDEHNLQPIRSIFPTTTPLFRGALYAILLALNHLTDIASAFSPTFQQYSLNLPNKAKARLGVLFSLLTSTSLERADMGERIEKVREGLQTCARRLMEAICGHGLGKGEEALLSAVGEVVRMMP